MGQAGFTASELTMHDLSRDGDEGVGCGVQGAVTLSIMSCMPRILLFLARELSEVHGHLVLQLIC